MTVKTLEIKKGSESKKYVETFLNRTCSHNLETIVKASEHLDAIYAKYNSLDLLMTFLLRGKIGRCYWVCEEPSGKIVRIYIGETHKSVKNLSIEALPLLAFSTIYD